MTAVMVFLIGFSARAETGDTGADSQVLTGESSADSQPLDSQESEVPDSDTGNGTEIITTSYTHGNTASELASEPGGTSWPQCATTPLSGGLAILLALLAIRRKRS